MLYAALLLLITLLTPGQVAFRINDPELIPEGIAYDPATKTFFVGSTFKRKIVAVDAAGTARDFVKEAQDGLFGVVGMRVDAKRRTLWAISSHAGAGMPGRGLDASCLGCSTVHGYNIDTGKLVKKYELPNKPSQHFLNDLTIASNGDLFITDSAARSVYRITPGAKALEPFVTLDASPNGIDVGADGRTLYVATAAGIRRVSVDKTVTPLAGTPADMPTVDGMYFHRGSLIAVQPFEEERTIVRYVINGDVISKTEVLAPGDPQLKQPTTGVIVGNDFYYIANAQLQLFRALYNSGTYDKSKLADIVISQLPLR